MSRRWGPGGIPRRGPRQPLASAVRPRQAQTRRSHASATFFGEGICNPYAKGIPTSSPSRRSTHNGAADDSEARPTFLDDPGEAFARLQTTFIAQAQDGLSVRRGPPCHPDRPRPQERVGPREDCGEAGYCQGLSHRQARGYPGMRRPSAVANRVASGVLERTPRPRPGVPHLRRPHPFRGSARPGNASRSTRIAHAVRGTDGGPDRRGPRTIVQHGRPACVTLVEEITPQDVEHSNDGARPPSIDNLLYPSFADDNYVFGNIRDQVAYVVTVLGSHMSPRGQELGPTKCDYIEAGDAADTTPRLWTPVEVNH